MALIRSVPLLAVLTLLAPVAHAAPAAGPSFDCAKASGAVEAAICAGPGLAARDRTMSQLYALVQTDALEVGPSGERAAQRAWEQARDKDCAAKGAAIASCLAGDYDDRLEALAAAALIRAPGPALAELRRQSPARAALYEAILDMATQPASAARTSAVAALVGPAFAAAKANPPDMLSNLAAAKDAAADIDDFAQFIDITAVTLDKPLILPCEAIVRQPGLAHALDGMYGSNMDNQLGGSDCADMLPLPPRFAAVAGAAVDKVDTPDCGSSRFLGLRNYERLLIQAQLRKTDQPWPKPDQTTLLGSIHWQASHAVDMAAAKADLAQYWVKELHAAPSPALSREAGFTLGFVIDEAFDVCEQG